MSDLDSCPTSMLDRALLSDRYRLPDSSRSAARVAPEKRCIPTACRAPSL